MARRIRTTALQATGGDVKIDGYFDRVIKYIPSDIVGAWVAITGLVPKTAEDPNAGTLLWVVFAVGLVLTAVWTGVQTYENGKLAPLQIAVSAVAFAVWVVALGRPFDSIHGFQHYYGPIALIGFTLISGWLVPKE